MTTLAIVLLAWLVLSVPVALVLGRALASSCRPVVRQARDGVPSRRL